MTLKPFDPVLYGEKNAAELDEFARVEKLRKKIHLEAISEDPKIDQSACLGQNGDFSEVRYALPDDNIIEKEVFGPARARQIRLDREKRKQTMLFPEGIIFDSDSEEEQGSAKNISSRTSAKQHVFSKKKKPEKREWRRYPDALTRKDTDFLKKIEEIDSETSDTFHKYLDGTISKHDSNAKNTEVNNEFTGCCGFIGARAHIADYTALEIEASEHARKTGMTVKEQLSNRRISECSNYYGGNSSCKSKTIDVSQSQQLKELESLRRLRQKVALDNFALSGETNAKTTKTTQATMQKVRNQAVTKLARVQEHRRALQKINRTINRTARRFEEMRRGPTPDISEDEVKQETESLFEAINEGNLKFTKLAIEFGASLVTEKHGKTPFNAVFSIVCRMDAGQEYEHAHVGNISGGGSWNTRGNYDSIADLLYSRGASIDEVEDPGLSSGYAPLHLAAKLGCCKMVKWLVDRNANVNILTGTGETPIMLACEKGHVNIAIRLMKSNADLHIVNESGMSILHFAAICGELKLLQLLFQCGVDKTLRSNDGRRAADICKQSGYIECNEYLLKASLKEILINEEGPASAAATLPCERRRIPDGCGIVSEVSNILRKKRRKKERSKRVLKLSHKTEWKKNWARMGTSME